MIRRQTGSGWFLITQNDHAKLSGHLAEQLGNPLFDAPSPKDRFVQAVSLHDCGWPLHDDAPTLNAMLQPLDVFETPRPIGLKVWSASVNHAAAVDTYAGLLVSLHVMALSMNATGNAIGNATAQKQGRFDLTDPTSRFELNKFQHRQIELQESFRRQLNMRTDLPLRHGLAEGSDEPAERTLEFEFRLLQAMDQLSLAICCTKPPATQMKPVLGRPGGRSLSLRVRRHTDGTLCVSPWPFASDQISVEVPYRCLPAEPFSDETAFRKKYAAASQERFTTTLLPARG